jgi:hypothetical protein
MNPMIVAAGEMNRMIEDDGRRAAAGPGGRPR